MRSSTLTSSTSLKYLLLIGNLLVLALLFYPTVAKIAEICWRDDAYSHGLILPIVVAYILWERRGDIARHLQVSPPFSIFGTLLLVIGIFLFYVGQAGGSLFASWVALIPTLGGLVFMTFGSRAGFAIFPPLCILYLAKPLPDSLIPQLFGPFQSLAARLSARSLELANVPVHVVGNIIEIPGMRLLVEEACSGMRSLMALLTVSVIVCFLLPLSLLSKILIVIISVFVALALNIFRVATTGFLAHFYSPESASGFFHTFSGMLVFLLGLTIVYLAGRLIVRLRGEKI